MIDSRGRSMYTSSKNRKNPDYSRYRAANNTKFTLLTHTAPFVSKAGNSTNIKDFQSIIIYPQRYEEDYGNAGAYKDLTRTSLYPQYKAAHKAQNLLLIAQGVDNTGRVGVKITMRSLNVIMSFRKGAEAQAPPVAYDEAIYTYVPQYSLAYGDETGNGNTTVYFNHDRQSTTLRVIIFLDCTPNNSVPTLSDLLEPGTVLLAPNRHSADEVFSVNSQLKSSATGRFKIIRNELIVLQGSETTTWSTFIDLSGLSVTYSGATASSCISNGIYMFVLPELMTAAPQNMPIYTYTAKPKFVP